VDLNMGCPDRSIEKQKSGAAMIKDFESARAVIRAAKEGWKAGVPDSSYRTDLVRIPVSVKTRIGYNREIIDEWIPILLAEHPAALTVHLRTRKEMSLVPAHWDLLPRVIALRDAISPETLIIGNGDVKDLDDARQKAAESGADGIMLGRAIFGNPWLFARGANNPEGDSNEIESIRGTPSIQEKLAALLELAREFVQLHPAKSFHILKKHIKAFVTGFDGAADLRARLMETESADELADIISSYRL